MSHPRHEGTAGQTSNGAPNIRARRLVWFLALWLAGVGAVAILAFLIRLLIP
ncbi:DUF2474 domain-containing protein [Pseudohoeflea coraliihabitans]|uniref:DUF2474 domain-containing protein n=1 Tax=Pseudohoeflea coraliihabitans TaxID=2860393 RepID=A0ABS6WP15_9HYPH|nr:DUF2474 domain-containing protein [Pseudohoeflea sp. DP4N28-3]MBW3097702.1 DUF2474 domain-containing protein [Pseudohoeflea sp. DP4N28-3]